MKNLPRMLKYLIWPGLMLLSAGLVVGLIEGWHLIAVALLVTGLLLSVAGIAASDYVGFWQRRSTRSGANAAVSVLSVLVILGLVNFLGGRYNSRVDFTDNQLLTLSPASQAVVRSLQQPTEVLLFASPGAPQDQRLLTNYRRLNSNFSYRYVDPFADPQLTRELGVETGGEVFVRAGGRDLLVQRVSPEEPLSEQKLTNSLAKLDQDNTAVVYFLQGHGEYAIDGSRAGMFEAANQLKDENYTVTPLNLAETGQIPADADIVIIAGAQKQLFDNEVKALRTFLDAGGSLFVMIDPQAKTGLEPLLNDWGVVAEDAFVIDTSGGGQLVGLGPAAPLVQAYGDHPITQAFDNGRSFFPVARPLQIKEVSGVQQTPLLFSNPRSYAQPVTTGDIQIDPNQAPTGPLVLGAALTRDAVAASSKDPATVNGAPAANGEQTDSPASSAKQESRLVVIGNSSYATDGLFNKQLNGDVFLNSVSWLSKQDNPILSIRPKATTDRRIVMTGFEQILLMLLSLLIFPLLGLAGAGVLWRRR